MNEPIVVAAPVYGLNGVNVFSANLVRGLRGLGLPATLLLTGRRETDRKPLPLPDGVPVEELRVPRRADTALRREAMRRTLEDRAPCVYLPNHDFALSCVSPALSNGVAVVGIVHSDDPQHYEHATRLGRSWNAAVAVSRRIAERTAALDVTLAPRLVTIPYGVPVPPEPPPRPPGDGRLRLVYAGRLVEEQKRVLDLPRVVAAALARGIPVELAIVGAGPDRARLERAAGALAGTGVIRFLGTLPNSDVLRVFEAADVFLLTSAYEGLPVSLLEAMGRACVPVVTRVESGVGELVRDGESGFLVPIGDVDAFAERLGRLHADPALRHRLAFAAHATVARGGYDVDTMAQRYASLFDRVLREARDGSFERPRGEIRPLPEPGPAARLLAPARRVLRRLSEAFVAARA